jgi:glycosyltransferase involved in cell wall biosynthesis
MTTPPTLTILIPTPGQGRPLARCLESIQAQPLLPGDEVLVIGDTLDGDLPEVEATVASFGPQYRYLPQAGTAHQIYDFGGYSKDCHSFGHEQIQFGMAQARGDYLVFQDDDDVFTAGAFEAIRRAATEHPGRPLLFRFVTRFRTLVWGASRELKQDHIGGHCFVVPNQPEYLGRWSDRYQGDWDFIRETLDKWPGGEGAVVWREEVIALARPDQ